MTKPAPVIAATTVAEDTTLIFETLGLAVKEKGNDDLLLALNISAELLKSNHNFNTLVLPFAAGTWQMKRINSIWDKAPKSQKSVFFFLPAAPVIAVAKPQRKRKPRKQVPQVAPGAPLANVTEYVSSVNIRDEDLTPMAMLFKQAAMKQQAPHA